MLPDHYAEWQAADPRQVHSPEDLHEYIDGGAELYLSFGFQRSYSLTLIRADEPETTITMDLFDMGSAENAYGLFMHGRVRPAGDIGQGSDLYGGLLVFWKGPYYVSILGYPITAAVEQALPELGRAIAAAIDESGEIPRLVRALPQDGLSAESVRYFRHPIWLNELYSVSDGDWLDMRSDSRAASGRYRRAQGTAVLMTIDYPNVERARGARDAFRKVFLKGSRGPVARPDGKWADCAQRDRLLAIVVNADEPGLVQGLLQQRIAALSEGE
jgi:hypothetical protein